MKQIFQDLKAGDTLLMDVPCPAVKPGHVLIQTSTSLLSAGTERMLLDFGKANLLDKARQQPDKVRMVMDKIRTDGLMPTVDAVRNKLDQPLPMGYSNAGVVVEVGPNATGFSIGDRVVSNGKHAEIVCVPANLCAKIPEDVSDNAAAFTVIGAIALQGIRLAQPTLGETVVVTGLGLIGLVAVQLLRAHGCSVLGIDLDPAKLDLAKTFGAKTVDLSRGEDPVEAAMALSSGRGVDAVLLTASTKSHEPVKQAAHMCRKRGRIVLVGVVGLELSRADFYEKELTFQVSCSYGPGRYDPLYEEGGQDYPIGYVRWTEQRNFEAVLGLLADGKLNPAPLISHRFPLDQAQKAYELVGSKEPSLGILLDYPNIQEKPANEILRRTVPILAQNKSTTPSTDKVIVGIIGSGNYATQVLIPAFKQADVSLKSVASSGGASGVHAGRKFGFKETTTDSSSLLNDSQVNTVVVTTRHDSHARFVCQALELDKHVFVEKPLALRREELLKIEHLHQKHQELILMVGFNRRFAPHIQKIKSLLQSVHEPKSFIMTVNAGVIPPEHWTQDSTVGGGRIIGEACHFIDLLRFLTGSPVLSVQAQMIGAFAGTPVQSDKVSFSLSFADGSMGTVHYLANGHKSFPKERLEVFCAGRILQLDNFRQLRGFGWPGFTKMNLWRQDKGQTACVSAFVKAIREGQASPIPFEELSEVTLATFDVMDAIGQG